MIFDIFGVKTLDEFLALSKTDIKDGGLDEYFEKMEGLGLIYADGDIIPEDWWNRLRDGSAEGVKVMIGAMSGENDWAPYDWESEDGALIDDPQAIWEGYIAAKSERAGADYAAKVPGYINPVKKDGTPGIDWEAFLETEFDDDVETAVKGGDPDDADDDENAEDDTDDDKAADFDADDVADDNDADGYDEDADDTDEDEAANRVKAAVDLYNAVVYVQGTEYEAEALSEYTDVYAYQWTYAPDPVSVIEYCESVGTEPEVSPYGRPQHSMGMLFGLGNTDDGYVELSGDPAKLSADLQPMIMSAYYNFAKAGDPNNDLIPQWTTYDAADRSTMVMGEQWQLVKDPRKAQRELLNVRPNGEK